MEQRYLAVLITAPTRTRQRIYRDLCSLQDDVKVLSPQPGHTHHPATPFGIDFIQQICMKYSQRHILLFQQHLQYQRDTPQTFIFKNASIYPY